MYDTIVSYREVTVSLQPYKQSDQGLHFCFDILSASFGCISIPFLISVYSYHFNMRFGLWKKDLFYNSSEELCKKKWGRNGMVIEGSERDGDLGGSGDGSLI